MIGACAGFVAVLCATVAVATLAFDLTLVVFKSGSMEPAIPTGSVALVREVPAADVHVGDVVTVDRPGDIPVTHRVVDTDPGADGTTVLTLKGDANAASDPSPYRVRAVREVLGSVAGAEVVVDGAGPAIAVVVSVVLLFGGLWLVRGRRRTAIRRSVD